MAIRKIAQLGHPVLRREAQPIPEGELDSEDFARVIEDLIVTMRDSGGVGIAAPQMHVLKRVFAMEVRSDNRYGVTDLLDLAIVINPQIESLTSRSAVHWEGCLSIAGLRGPVARSQDVLLIGLDPGGVRVERELRGFPAIIAQHEVDHLDGCLFIDRMEDMRQLSFETEFRRFHEEGEGVAEPGPLEQTLGEET